MSKIRRRQLPLEVTVHSDGWFDGQVMLYPKGLKSKSYRNITIPDWLVVLKLLVNHSLIGTYWTHCEIKSTLAYLLISTPR